MARAAGKKTPPAKKPAANEAKYLCPYCMKEKKESDFHYTNSNLFSENLSF